MFKMKSLKSQLSQNTATIKPDLNAYASKKTRIQKFLDRNKEDVSVEPGTKKLKIVTNNSGGIKFNFPLAVSE